MTKIVIVYSHGFGVRRDDRGLFTDISVALPDAEHVMFDYNYVDEIQDRLTVAPLTEQATRLARVLNETKSKYPDARIDLICHSQGCVVAGMLQPDTMISRRTCAG